MNANLKIFLISICILLIIHIYRKVITNKLDFKYAFYWIMTIIILMVLCIFDNILVPIKNILGFEVTSNMIFFIGFILLIVLLLTLSIKVNKQSEKITKLAQELALLKGEYDEKNNK